MVDFSNLLRKPAGEAKRPKALPIGDYLAKIRTHEIGDNNRNRTPYVRFGLVMLGWPETVSMDDREDTDLSRRQLRKDFYLTEESLWRLDAFIKSCGLNIDGQTYEEILPQLIGQDVVVEVQHYLNSQTNEIGNTVGNVVGTAG